MGMNNVVLDIEIIVMSMLFFFMDLLQVDVILN